MSEFRAAYRYALAVIGVAQEMKKLDEVNRDFEAIEKLTAGSREFLLFLQSPVVNKERKKQLLGEIFQGKVGDITKKFVLLLAAKGREGLLPEIIRQFYRLRDEILGVVNVSVKATISLNAEQERVLKGVLEQATKKSVRLTSAIDASLKGGFTVQHDDTVWDASVRHQLERLRERFIEGTA